MHHIRAIHGIRAYSGADFPRKPLALDPGQEAVVDDEMLAVLIDAGAIELVTEFAAVAKSPERAAIKSRVRP